MSCDNCKNCYVLKISEKLRMVYDWSSKSNSTHMMFDHCGKDDCYFNNNNNENVMCFVKRFAKTLNWKELEKFYMAHKEEIDRGMGVAKS